MESLTDLATLSSAGAVVVSSLYLLYRVSKRRADARRARDVTISHIIFYPIKGCRGIERYSVEITDAGIMHDREYAIVDVKEASDKSGSKPLSLLTCPNLLRLTPCVVSGASITITSPGVESLVHKPVTKGSKCVLDLFGDTIDAVDQGDVASTWLSSVLDRPVRFVRIVPGKRRDSTKSSQLWSTSPILLISGASLQSLGDTVHTPLDHSRFRPNIVLSGLTPYAEDSAASFTLGDVTLEGKELCDRCAIPSMDQSTAAINTGLLGRMRLARCPEEMTNVRKEYIPALKEGRYYVGLFCQPHVDKVSRIYVGQSVNVQ